jgi:hypothetical protein
MAEDHRDLDFATILGNQFLDVLTPVVGAEVSRHDFYSAITDTFGEAASPALLARIVSSESELSLLRRGFEKYFECRSIDEGDLRNAIERTLRSALAGPLRGTKP